MGAPEVPPLCRETQSLGQQMLNAPFGINGLTAYLFESIADGEMRFAHNLDLSFKIEVIKLAIYIFDSSETIIAFRYCRNVGSFFIITFKLKGEFQIVMVS